MIRGSAGTFGASGRAVGRRTGPFPQIADIPGGLTGTIADMLAGAPIIVHVINSGTDWLALAAVTSTGVVGLAGIGAAVWQASRGWARDEKRAATAEKRRIYAECLAAFNDAVSGLRDMELATERGDTPTDSVRADYNTARDRIRRMAFEATLIAPDAVADLIAEALHTVNKRTWDPGQRVLELPLGRLAKTMRYDIDNKPLPDADSQSVGPESPT